MVRFPPTSLPRWWSGWVVHAKSSHIMPTHPKPKASTAFTDHCHWRWKGGLLLQCEDWVPGFLQRIHPAPDWESFQNVGPSRCHLIFLCLKRNSHNLQCVPWGRRCQAGMIGGFQNSTAVARTEGRVTQITPKQCKKYPGLSHIDWSTQVLHSIALEIFGNRPHMVKQS